jgi:hypothetical protein
MEDLIKFQKAVRLHTVSNIQVKLLKSDFTDDEKNKFLEFLINYEKEL